MSGTAKASGRLYPAAAAFEFVVVWLAIAGAVLAGWPNEIGGGDWAAFGVLVPIIAAVHLAGAERQKHQGIAPSLAPIFAAVLILRPALAAIAIALYVRHFNAVVAQELECARRWTGRLPSS